MSEKIEACLFCEELIKIKEHYQLSDQLPERCGDFFIAYGKACNEGIVTTSMTSIFNRLRRL